MAATNWNKHVRKYDVYDLIDLLDCYDCNNLRCLCSDVFAPTELEPYQTMLKRKWLLFILHFPCYISTVPLMYTPTSNLKKGSRWRRERNNPHANVSLFKCHVPPLKDPYNHRRWRYKKQVINKIETRIIIKNPYICIYMYNEDMWLQKQLCGRLQSQQKWSNNIIK